MATGKTERVVRIVVVLLLLLTMGLAAVAYSYLRRPTPDDPWTYQDVPDRTPDAALEDLAAVLGGSRGRFLRTVLPETRTDSHQLHFEWRGKALQARVVPEGADTLNGKLVWETPGGLRTICRGVRPGGFQVMDLSDAWVLKLIVVRTDPEGKLADVVATRMVKKKR